MSKNYSEIVLEVTKLTNEDFEKLVNSELVRLHEEEVLDFNYFVENDLIHVLIVTKKNVVEIIYDLRSQSISNNCVSRKGVDSAWDVYLDYEDEIDVLPFSRLDEKITASMDISNRKPTPRLVHKLMYAIEMLKEKDYGLAGFKYTEDIENGLLTLFFEADGEVFKCIYNSKENKLEILGLSDIS